MFILLLIGIALTGAAVVLAARGLAFGGLRRHETLAQIAAYGFSGQARPVGDEDREPRSVRSALNGLATLVGKPVLRALGTTREREIRKLLRSAGAYHSEPATFLGYRIVAGVLLPLLLLWLRLNSGGIDPRGLLLVVLVGVLGWVLPGLMLKRRAKARLQAIDLEMPELVDLLVTTVEAGVGFAAALQLVARRVQGPLGEELRITLREHGMGLTLEDALENMLGRVDSGSIRVFVQAIIQGQTLGVSIGKILRDLALDMRKRRRQMAEERAQKAPTKILFPLVFLILPALFIIVLGGPVIGLGKTLGGQL